MQIDIEKRACVYISWLCGAWICKWYFIFTYALTVSLMAFPIQSHQITMTKYSKRNSINYMGK